MVVSGSGSGGGTEGERRASSSACVDDAPARPRLPCPVLQRASSVVSAWLSGGPVRTGCR